MNGKSNRTDFVVISHSQAKYSMDRHGSGYGGTAPLHNWLGDMCPQCGPGSYANARKGFKMLH